MKNSAIRTELDDKLTRIRQILLDMAAMVARRVDEVTIAFLERDILKADALIEEDDVLDLASLEVEQLCIETLLREQPVASDLRAVIAAMHMNSDIERSGDLTTNIAKAVGRLQGSNTDDEIRDLILRMAEQAKLLFERSAEAYEELDAEKAAAIDELDDVLDDLHRTYIGTVINKSRQGGLHPQQTLQLALIGRFYERIGDHAENLGERIRYIVDGWTPEQAAADRARERSGDQADVQPPSRGLALIEQQAEQRRIDDTRRDFVANVSHELKTPVAAIALLAEALVGSNDNALGTAPTEPADQNAIVGQLGREVSRIEAIIDDLLALARLEESETAEGGPGPFEPVDIDVAVGQAVDIVSGLAEASKVSLAVNGVPSGVSVTGDQRQIVRALVNLLDNAVRYSDQGSQVTMTVESVVDGVDLSVADTGIGIARPELERIFERFYRVDPARSRDTGGTGLGLSIVRHVATNHRGRILVESKLGEGSIFTMHLPTGPQ